MKKQMINEKFDLYGKAFDENFPRILIPYEKSLCKDYLPPIEGTNLIAQAPLFDNILCGLLDYDFVDFECETPEHKKVINAWLLRRIEKVLNLGWEKYCDQYK